MFDDALINIPEILSGIDLRPGMRVADFGAGRNGHFVIPAARMVGEDGAVFAIEIHPEALSTLQGHRSLHEIPQLQIIRGDIERFGGIEGIPDRSLDRIFLVNTLWMTRRFASIVAEMRRLLAPDGKIIFIDWEPKSRHAIAPDPSLRVAPGAIDRLFAEGGCRQCGVFQPSRHHFGRIYSH